MEEKEFNFKFNLTELQTILKGLEILPYRESALIIRKIIALYEKEDQENEEEIYIKREKEEENENCLFLIVL